MFMEVFSRASPPVEAGAELEELRALHPVRRAAAVSTDKNLTLLFIKKRPFIN